MTPDAMAALHGRCFTMPRPWSADEFRSLLTDTTVFAHFEPHGFVLGRSVLDEAELLTLAVDPLSQRRGLGQQLTQAFIQTAQTRGAASACLEVAATNLAAISLYEKTGFTPTGKRPRYYRTDDGTRVDALVLGRKIHPNPEFPVR